MTQVTRHLVGVAEASQLTGLDKATIYRLARQGRLRSYRVLAAIRFDRADLLALVRERQIEDIFGPKSKASSRNVEGGKC